MNKSEESSLARVIAEHKEMYVVKNSSGEYFAKITGKRIFNALSREDYPAVGDWVMINVQNNEQAIINEILPRQTIIKRKHGKKDEIQIIACNIDFAFIVESVGRDFNLNRFERYITISNDGGVKPIIILNKVDLITKEELNLKLDQIKNRFKDIKIILTSTINSTGLAELRRSILPDKTYCFLGSSGVGKSSLINKLLEEDVIETKNISLQTDRGKHTTTSREMYFLKDGGIVIDNPGIREVGITDEIDGVNNIFDEIVALARDCQFADCSHISEPGCNVLSALSAGELDVEKYSNYLNLKKEINYYEMTALEKKEKDRQFGKFIKNTKKEMKRLDLGNLT